ncbi:MAG: LysR family transcriptional regulator [Herbaspirillum sp.]|nr:LysR family transcriptional regulator [Herbaspirillum sp.]
MLDMNEVAVFVQVARTGSFAEAARRLGKPANTLSRHVQQLEQHLGTRLMQRSTRKLVLTAAGRAFYERCAPAVEGIEAAGHALIEGSQVACGVVRVAAPADFFDFFRVEWIEEFLDAHPAVRMQFLLDDAEADLISEGIDLAFRGGQVTDLTLVARKIQDHHLCLAASPAYLERYGSPASVAALADHQCIIAPHLSDHAGWRLDGPDGAVEVQVSGKFSVNTAQTKLKACRAGLGIALLPAILVAPDIRAGHLIHVLPEFKLAGQGIHLVYLNRRHLPLAVSAFIEFIMQRVADLEFVSPREACGR